EVINRALRLEKKIPLVYIPNGTTNDTANTLSLPKHLSELASIIKNDKYQKCDIGSFNNRYFFCAVSFGIGAEASFSTRQSLKNEIGHVAYILSNIKNIPTVRPVKMNIEYDDQKISGEFIFGAVINTKSVGGMFKLDENVFRINDGKFEIVLVRKLDSIFEIPFAIEKLQKREYDNEKIILLQASKVKFSSPDEVAWLIDGENGGKLTEVKVENINQGIEICAPDSIIFEK
ncbi:MAG: YegS/Rv2252/BmrU family lipid kinase, partial [Eubacterium sp.]|nr:YegS/Rv2252/BmrU family lipid kinase [Eubacterium sp.]